MSEEEIFEGIPLVVIKALAGVRASGRTNMFDRRAVTMLVWWENDGEAAERWLLDNEARYMDALQAMGRYISRR